MIISKYALDCVQYNSKYETVTWETCTLRKWLNEIFIDVAFNLDEQLLIQETNVSANKNPKYDTDPGKSTNDKIFLLSLNEVNKYFSSNEERMCAATDYAIAQGAWTLVDYKLEGKLLCWQWLRSPGYDQNSAARVGLSGSVIYDGSVASSDDGCIRPAMWISLE